MATTYRVTEHYLSGAMTWHDAVLNELQPAMFFEISPELRLLCGLKNLDWAVVSTPRDAIQAQGARPPSGCSRCWWMAGTRMSSGCSGPWLQGRSGGRQRQRPFADGAGAECRHSGHKVLCLPVARRRLATPRPLTPETPAPMPVISSTAQRAADERSDRHAD